MDSNPERAEVISELSRSCYFSSCLGKLVAGLEAKVPVRNDADRVTFVFSLRSFKEHVAVETTWA